MLKLLSTMGCLCSRGVAEENNPRTFKVINVDDLGQERNPGRIEITESELVWYQRGKEPIRWPLKSLRRYGFDAELFSFESGRRCPTGPGIYAFKCRRAEALFNLLQESIQRQRTGQEDGSGPTASSPIINNPTVQSAHAQQALPRTNPNSADGVIMVSSNSRPHSAEVSADPLVPNGPSPPVYVNVNGSTHIPEYINTEFNTSARASRENSIVDPSVVGVVVPPAPRTTEEDHVIQYAELDLPKLEDGNVCDSVTTSHNGHGPPRGGDSVQVNPANQQVMYVNVPANEIKKKTSNPGTKPIGNGTKPVCNGLSRQYSKDDSRGFAVAKPSGSVANGSKVNYIQIDHGDDSSALNQSPLPASLLCAPESPTRKTDTYARIDIERTQALNHRRNSTGDEGSRKTRHNSNIEELYGDAIG